MLKGPPWQIVGREDRHGGGNIAGMQRPRSIIQNPTKMLVLAALPPVEALLIIQLH